MAQVPNPKKKITLWYNEDPSHKAIAVAVQAQWKKLGIDVTLKAQEWAQYLEFLGPPPNNAVDAYRLGWIGDYVDAMNFLEQWTCGSGNNNTNYCDQGYDKLVAKARGTPDDQKRYELYGQLERSCSARTATCRSCRSTGTRTRSSSGSRSRTLTTSTCSIRST